MKALLLIAHGSRRQASNHEVLQLGETMNTQLHGEFPIIQTAFLELAAPLIPDAIDICVAQGASEIHIVPYFLAAGRHVFEDIPEEVAKAQSHHPHVSMDIYPHIGGSTMMTNLIKETLARQQQKGLNQTHVSV